MSVRGHYWTFRPFVEHLVRPLAPPPSRHFRAYAEDPERGRIRMTGRLRDLGGDAIVVIIHGLGGSHGSYYCIHAAHAAERAGLSHVRVNLRGADRMGDDLYHAALTDDLRAILASPDLARHRTIHLLGYSLGGHLALRYLAEPDPDPRVASVATVCSPLDIAPGVAEIDQPKGRVYRTNVLNGLKDIYRHVVARGRGHAPFHVVRRITTIRDWDETVVAPRFGFRDAEDYWARASVGPMLDRVDRPALAVVAEEDPMVFTHIVRPRLESADNVRTVFTSRGGHVGFPEGVDLGLGHGGKVEDQIVGWLRDPE